MKRFTAFCRALALAGFFSLAIPPVSLGADITLNPVADTTLSETVPNNNNGGQTFFNAGTTQNGPRTRGLLMFDFGSIPAGSLITSAELVVEAVGQPSDGFDTDTFGLSRVLKAWGEGNKTAANPNAPGQGAAASVGEATWNQRLNGVAAWGAPGGLAAVDYSTTVSAEQIIYTSGNAYTFGSTPEMVADVQYWLDNPSANFGWMLAGENEQVRFTARRFGSRESVFDAPRLLVSYTPVPEPATWALCGAGLALLAVRRKTKPV
jgi:hypothetical protein